MPVARMPGLGAAPLTPILDAFTRDDGGVGAPWTANPAGAGYGQFDVVGNQMKPVGPGGAWMYWDDFYPDASESYVTVASITSGEVELERIYGAGTTDWGGYAFLWRASTSEFTLRKYATGGAITNLNGVGGSFDDGDGMMLRIIPPFLFGLHRPAGEGWRQVVSFRDPGYTGGGKPVLYAESATTVFDDWGGGNLVLPPARFVQRQQVVA